MYHFGAGTLYATPTTGNLAPNPTPLKFGTLQDVSVDFAGDVKELYGNSQVADDVARGKIKITWKAAIGNIQGKVFNDIFFGQTPNPTNKMNLVSVDESAPIPASPYQITVAQAAAPPQVDLGVRYSSTGLPLTKVASAPAQGQYSVVIATGVYTFAAADTGATVLISYSYLSAAAIGMTLKIKNQLMGFAPRFQLFLSQAYNVLQSNMLLYSCLATKLAWQTKNEDYTVPAIEGSAFMDAAGNVVDLYEQQ